METTTDSRFSYSSLSDTDSADTAYNPSAYITHPDHSFDETDPCRYDGASATTVSFKRLTVPLPYTLPLSPPESPPRQPSPSFNFQPLLQRAGTVIRGASPSAQTRARTYHRAEKSFNDLADMFRGSSAPVRGFAMSPKPDETEDKSGRGAAARGGLQAAASFLGFSSSKSSLTSHARRQSLDERDVDDPILSLNLEAELFPKGVPGAAAPSAEAYDELVANASRLFLRMQQAYQSKHTALREVQASKTFEQEELEEARMRAKHLKLQLDGMSAVVAEQTEAIQDLQTELEEERATSRRLERTIRLVEPSELADTDGESDAESHVESVFSRESKSTRCTIDRYSADEMAPWLPPAESTAELRNENGRLKARVAELEETVNGCLGLFGDL